MKYFSLFLLLSSFSVFASPRLDIVCTYIDPNLEWPNSIRIFNLKVNRINAVVEELIHDQQNPIYVLGRHQFRLRQVDSKNYIFTDLVSGLYLDACSKNEWNFPNKQVGF